MRTLDKIFRVLGKRTSATPSNNEKIPNGWGRQNYEGEAKNAIYEEPVDLKNINRKRGWIRAFLANKVEGLNPRINKKWRYPYYPLTYNTETNS